MSISPGTEELGPKPNRRLWSINEVIHSLGVGRTTTYDLIASGKLKTVKIGRRRFVTAEALDAFIAGLTD